MKYITYFTKGLEEIVKKELEDNIRDIQILEVGNKRIVFESPDEASNLVELKTVDDLGIFIGSRSDANFAEDIVNVLDVAKIEEIRKFISGFRSINNTFSLTLSLAGVRGFTPDQLLNALRDDINKRFHWEFTELEHINFDIRIFIDVDQAYASVRLTKDSLRGRAYKTQSKEGSLKPTVAAAMVLLATNDKKTGKVVDNFCGSGTILCESYRKGFDVYGGDIDLQSVQISKGNLSNLGFKQLNNIKNLNACSTPWQSGSLDFAISNLPWNKQVEVENITKLYEGSIKEYARILKPTGVLCALVSKPELFIKYTKKYFFDKKIRQVKIGLLGQNPTVVVVRS